MSVCGLAGYRRSMRPHTGTTGSAIVLAAAVVVASRGVPTWDRSAFMMINGLPDILQYPLWAPMQMGSLGGSLAAGAVVGFRGDKDRGVEIAVSGVTAWIAAKVIKRIVNRDRPAASIPSTELRIGAADTGLGFPSGHVAVATTLAAAMSRDRALAVGAAWCAIPGIVGFSRVHVGAHYPLDVVGGWAAGVVVSRLTATMLGTLRRHLRATWSRSIVAVPAR